jgi:hypothetical protein
MEEKYDFNIFPGGRYELPKTHYSFNNEFGDYSHRSYKSGSSTYD